MRWMSYPVVLEKNQGGGWTVTCPILPGCISEGDTKREALDNIKDAIHLYLRAVKKELNSKAFSESQEFH